MTKVNLPAHRRGDFFVEHLDGLLAALLVRHLDESETARTLGRVILRNEDRNDFTSLREHLTQIVLAHAERNAADEQFVGHSKFLN